MPRYKNIFLNAQRSKVKAWISIPDFGVDFYRTHFFMKIGFAYI